MSAEQWWKDDYQRKIEELGEKSLVEGHFVHHETLFKSPRN
jgi:hypothetical protein